MPWFLIKIRKARWYKDPEFSSWLGENEIPSDPLADLNTSTNKLSIWKVDDDESNLNNIIIALTTNRNCIVNFDYALFDANILSEINIELKHSQGMSKYNEANELWHYDAIEITADKILILAEEIYKKGIKKRINEKSVIKLFSENPDILMELDQEKLEPKIKETINNTLR